MLCVSTYGGVSSHAQSLVEDAIDDLATYLGNQGTDWSFGTYFTQHTIGTGYNSEREYVIEVLDWLDSNDSVLDGDAWIIVHGEYNYGFGGGVVKDPNELNKTVHGAAVWGGTYSTNEKLQKMMAKHEMGHNLGASHYDGCRSMSSTGYLYSITPLATSYTYDSNDTCDTHDMAARDYACGTGSEPNTFRCGRDNYVGDGFYGPDWRWQNQISQDTIDEVFSDRHYNDWLLG